MGECVGALFTLTWALSPLTGWGKVGLALQRHLAARGDTTLLLSPPAAEHFPAAQGQALAALHAPVAPALRLLAEHPDREITLDPAVVVHAFGNNLSCDETLLRVRSSHKVALVAIEDSRIDPARLARLADCDRVITHSRFARDMLAGYGVANLAVTYQGVDPQLFRPRPTSGRFGDRFVVFSGGKLEYRKGQDLVVAAFARFAAHHPDSLLVCAWASFWPQSAYSINQGVLARPLTAGPDGRPHIRRWLSDNGVAAADALVLDHYGAAELAEILADCHVALFPNRCEGCTNLVAMEAMAAGVPTVLSANTGHADLLAAGCGSGLTLQRPVTDPDGSRQGWGDSDVDEMVDRLEWAYHQRAEAQAAAARAAAIVGRRSWDRFAGNTLATAAGGGTGESAFTC